MRLKINRNVIPINQFFFFSVMMMFVFQVHATKNQDNILLSCKENNDLYLTLLENKISCARFNTPEEAINNAEEGAGVMILADDYPEKTTVIANPLFEKAHKKRLRLYVEYPSSLPGVEVGTPRKTFWERAVISSDAFAPALQKLRIIAIHDCHFVTLQSDNPDIVIARVAGFDSAVFGLPNEIYTVLCEIPQLKEKGGLMVATTKLSQFITARYAPADAWQAIWEHILAWLSPTQKGIELKWTPSVRPAFSADEQLPVNVEKNALEKGINWYFNSRMIMSPSLLSKYNQPANNPEPGSANPDLTKNWPFGHRVGFMPDMNSPVGDGTLGILEGFDAKIFFDGSQPVRWWKRSDCNGEVAGAMGLAGLALQNQKYITTAGNIGDWLFCLSAMTLGDRANPNHQAYGLFGWNDSPQYVGTGSMNGFEVYYGDDNARVVLGMLMASVAQKTDRYNERLSVNLLANLRLSSVYGFQPNRIDQPTLVREGWEHWFTGKVISYSPHYQANMWACYLWAYRHTGFELFLKRAIKAIEMTMDAYPDNWKWTNGIQQERAKMLLPLAWLVQTDNNPLYREWLRKIATDLLSNQDKSGAIREEIGGSGKGGFPPPSTNEAYGTTETPLIQTNEDGVSDLLYTIEFAFIGLHEAAAATKDPFYRDAENKLAEFLTRIQIQSEKQPELSGGWFRAFDFNRWEYWASNGDAGWGAWCIETGWSQSWITAVLALRHMNKSLWDITEEIKIDNDFDALRRQMIPVKIINEIK